MGALSKVLRQGKRKKVKEDPRRENTKEGEKEIRGKRGIGDMGKGDLEKDTRGGRGTNHIKISHIKIRGKGTEKSVYNFENSGEYKEYDMLSLEKVSMETPDNAEEWKVPVKFVKQISRKKANKDTVTGKYDALKINEEEGKTVNRKNPFQALEPIDEDDDEAQVKQINILEKHEEKNIDNVKEDEWEPMPRPLVIDSGAAETVIPSEWFPLHDTLESHGSKSGVYYTTADGTPVYNEGEKTLTMSTLDGEHARKMTFQVARVNKALGSVSKIVNNGNRVVFDQSGSYIENTWTKDRIWLREDNGGVRSGHVSGAAGEEE